MTGIEAAFQGTLGRAPELRRVKGGELPLLTLAVAVQAGNRGDDQPTTWVRVVVFGDTADDLAPKLAKGARVYVEGRLSLDRWEAGDGTPKAGLSVVAGLVQPLGQIGRRRPQGDQQARRRQRPRNAYAKPSPSRQSAPLAPGELDDPVDDVGTGAVSR